MSLLKNGSVGSHEHHLVIAFLMSSLVLSKNTAASLPNDAVVISPLEAADVRENSSCVGCHNINRRDPLNRFKYYHGGYDIQNKHYWASAAFTGVHGYAVAGFWMICGVGLGIFVVTKFCCCVGNTTPSETSSSSCCTPVVMFWVVVLFTFLAIAASIVVLVANQKSMHKTNRLRKTILGAGTDAIIIIRNVTQTMGNMENLLKPYDSSAATELNSSAIMLHNKSTDIRDFVDQTSHSIRLATSTWYVAHLVVVIVNTLLLFAAIVLLLLSLRPWFIIIIILCWFITTLVWVITGFDFFFHNFAEDTCYAFRDYLRYPESSSLGLILPCIKSSYTNKVFLEIGSAAFNFVELLNSKIGELREALMSGTWSGGLSDIIRVCQPFSGPPGYTYIGNCSEGEIPIAEVPQIMAEFTCYKNESRASCLINGKFIPESIYNITAAVSMSITDLINIYPDLQNLSQCSFMKDRMKEILSHQCRPFQSSILMLWASMLSLSILMVILVLLWIIRAYQHKESWRSIFTRSEPRATDPT